MSLGIGEPDDLVADHLVRETEVAVDGVERTRLGLDLEHHVEPFVLVVDLVGEATSAPLLGLGHGAIRSLDLGRDRVDHAGDGALVELPVEDDHHFVSSHREHHLPVDPAAPGPLAELPGAGS